jgi:hypothetical protein
MQFPHDLEATARRTAGGDYAWPRGDALRAANVLRTAGMAILGGELWLVQGRAVSGLLPRATGLSSVYRWESERQPTESWADFVARSYSETIGAIDSLPYVDELQLPPDAAIYYNLTWTAQTD